MSATVETWNTNLLDIGPLYPFAGSETLMVIVGVGLWLLWHILQARQEAHEIESDQKAIEGEQLRSIVERSRD